MTGAAPVIYAGGRRLHHTTVPTAVRLPAPPRVVRLLHFMFTGGLAGLLQIYLLMVFTHYGWPPVAASATAALLGAQLNFMLSSLITWRDRPAEVLWRRWLLYQGSIVGTMALSVLVFSLLHTIYPAVMASAGGILAGGIANFILGNHLVFRKRLPAAAMHDQARQQTLVT